MERVLSRFKLACQIGAIGALGLLGLVAVGAVYYVGNLKQQEIQALADRVAANNNRGAAVEINLLNARRAEKDFLLRRADDYAARHAKLISEVNRLLDELRKILEINDNLEAAGHVVTISQGVATYAKQFAI